ncbi:hypothetical protein PInf_003972 [Phytophthora infestans]|nr:hypothetical protein PInf_003972 [Phytophthora infestans]
MQYIFRFLRSHGSPGSANSHAALVAGGERYNSHLYPHNTEYRGARRQVLRDQDIAQLESPLTTSELRALLLADK